MRAALLVTSTFLLALAAGAQTVATDELTYGPFTPAPRDPSLSIAVAKHGMLLAWSEADPGSTVPVVHTGLLDFNAQLVGPINALYSLAEGHPAVAPVAATDGDRFFVAWVESDPFTFEPKRIAGAMTDAKGSPIDDTKPLGKAVAGAPSVIWDGAFRVYGDASYAIGPTGAVSSTRGAAPRRVPFATADAVGWVTWSNTSTQPYACIGRCSGPKPWYGLEWTVLTARGVRAGQLVQYGYLSEKPAVSADGTSQLVVWTTDRGLAATRLSNGVSRRVFGFSYPTDGDPAIAEELVVFESDGDVFGVKIEGDSFGTPFPISTGDEWDTRPGVYPVSPGRYLVTYVREHSPSSVTLAGRFVTVP